MTRWRRVGLRKLQLDTDQYQVLAIVRPPENATAAQIADTTAWRLHTVRSSLAELEKREGIAVSVAERVRQIGPNWESAKDSYTIFRIIQEG